MTSNEYDGLLRYGNDYAKYGLPYQNIDVLPMPGGKGPSAELPYYDSGANFVPNWSGAGSSTADLAYAIYPFDVTDERYENRILFVWGDEIPVEECWIGLAHRGAQHWDWFQMDAQGYIHVDGFFGQYSGYGNQLLVAVVLTGTESWNLDHMRIGDQIRPQIVSVSPLTGESGETITLTVEVTGTPRLTVEGYLEHYEYLLSTDNTTYRTTIELGAPGQYACAVWATNAEGVDVLPFTFTVTPAPSWQHSFGGSADDVVAGVFRRNSKIYVAGTTQSYGENGAIFTLQYDLDGNLLNAVLFDGPGIERAAAISAAGNGYVVVGETTSYGAGDSDILILQYADDGRLQEAATWGGAQRDYATTALNLGLNLYIGGGTFSAGGAGENAVLLYLYNGAYPNGPLELLHSNVWSTGADDRIVDVVQYSSQTGMGYYDGNASGWWACAQVGNSIQLNNISDFTFFKYPYSWTPLGANDVELTSAAGQFWCDEMLLGGTLTRGAGAEKDAVLLRITEPENVAGGWSASVLHSAGDTWCSGVSTDWDYDRDQIYLCGRHRSAPGESYDLWVARLDPSAALMSALLWRDSSLSPASDELGVDLCLTGYGQPAVAGLGLSAADGWSSLNMTQTALIQGVDYTVQAGVHGETLRDFDPGADWIWNQDERPAFTEITSYVADSGGGGADCLLVQGNLP